MLNDLGGNPYNSHSLVLRFNQDIWKNQKSTKKGHTVLFVGLLKFASKYFKVNRSIVIYFLLCL